MSKEALAKVVQRAISDGAFRRQLSSDPATALRGFDLSGDEAAAIRSGDSGRLSALGVDLRMSKAFTLSSDQATGDAMRPVLSNDLGASYTGATTSAGQGAAGSSALSSGNAGDHDALITSGDSSGREGALIGGEPAHALGSETSGDNSGTFGNVLTPGDNSTDGILVVDDQGLSGAVTPGEAATGPTIQE